MLWIPGLDMPRRPDVKHRGVFERPKGSGIFWIRYYIQGREFREKVGKKSDAIARYQQRKQQAREGQLPQRIPDRLFADFVVEFLEAQRARMRSFADYQRYAKRWAQRFKGRTLRSILPLDVETWAARRAQVAAAATVNRELSFLRRVFNVALANDLVERSPVKGIKFYRENNARVRWLADDEEARLRHEIGEDCWPLVSLAIQTGLRQSEQFRLRWTDVDFANGILTIPRTKHGETRHVHLSETALTILRSAQTRLKGPYVFASRIGTTSLDPKNFLHRHFIPAVRRARIEDFRWHDLRHTFASRLVMRGADLRTVQELLGHKTIAMTLRYAHLSPAHLHAAVRLLDPVPGTDKQDRTGTKPAPEAIRLPDGKSGENEQVVELKRKEQSGRYWARTSDPRLVRPMLSQLS